MQESMEGPRPASSARRRAGGCRRGGGRRRHRGHPGGGAGGGHRHPPARDLPVRAAGRDHPAARHLRGFDVRRGGARHPDQHPRHPGQRADDLRRIRNDPARRGETGARHRLQRLVHRRPVLGGLPAGALAVSRARRAVLRLARRLHGGAARRGDGRARAPAADRGRRDAGVAGECS